jgi:hypothetical protein
MALRGQVQDSQATYEDPIFGVNLRDSEEDLVAGESSNMKNMVHFGGTVSRQGSNALNATALGSGDNILGGHKFYYAGSSGERLVVYDKDVSVLSDAGSETNIWSKWSLENIATFYTWSITESVYLSSYDALDSNETLRYDGTSIGPLGFTDLTDGTTYKWTQSLGSSDEYYCELFAGGDPGLSSPASTGGVYINGSSATAGAVGSLGSNQWAYGNHASDGLGYNTIYVELSDTSDPDTKGTSYVLHMNQTNAPGQGSVSSSRQILGFSDRLFAITSNGIERTNAQSDSVWSNDSSWATYRPFETGQFRAMIRHTAQGTDATPLEGVIAVSESDYYFFSGTSFGDDVTHVSDTTGDNSVFRHIDRIGCLEPQHITSVPGIGVFWITNDKNIFYVPSGRLQGVRVGTRIINTGTTTTVGLESLDTGGTQNGWIIYKEPYLMVGFQQTGTSNGPNIQYWMDMEKFRIDPSTPVWYGPMTGQTINVVWLEQQQGDNEIYGGESNKSTGAFVYELRKDSTYTDDVGTSTNNISCEYATYVKSGGAPSREKVVQQIDIEMNDTLTDVTADIADLNETILTSVPVEKTYTS